MAANGNVTAKNATELETFLPQDGSDLKDGAQHGKYKVNVFSASKDAEAGGKGRFDPFKDRVSMPNSTTDCDTLTHLLKAALGTGILAMPDAFRNAGMSVGIVCTVLVAVICTHCSYVVVKCAHELYYRTRTTSMSFADVGEVAFANGPPWGRKFSTVARLSIQVGLFAAYFGTCSAYTVIIAKNFLQVVNYYTETEVDERLLIGSLLIPLILLSWVPNLKKLAPVSMVANVFMGVGLLITFYYLVWDLPPVSDRPQVAPLIQLPQFFSVTIFAMEAIGVVMPLENAMQTPQHFIGLCGVLNQGMGGVTLIYILLGFLGYLKYGEGTYGSITLNLPTQSIAAQAVKVLVGLAVFCTYGLQYFVCLEIVWNGLKDRFKKNTKMADYLVRTILTTCTVVLAVAVPTISPFLALIGALCFSLLGLIIPVFIEMVTYWEVGFGKYNWVIWKNVLVLIFGILALIFGTYTSALDIVKLYVEDESPILQNGQNVTTLLSSILNDTNTGSALALESTTDLAAL